MKNKLNNEVSILDACVIEYDYIYIASALDCLDPRKYRISRMSSYVGSLVASGRKWFYHDVGMHVMSVCVKKATKAVGRRLCTLSREGDVEIYSNGDGSILLEKIPGAGLQPDNMTRGLAGYVTNIREIGASLYVCGISGQVYRRVGEGKWVEMDKGLYKPLTDPAGEHENMFTCIDGNSESDIYVVGMNGVIFHFDGEQWTSVDSSTHSHLNWVRCYGDDVYICGSDGVLLKGNRDIGFEHVGSTDVDLTWRCVCEFEGKVYLGSNCGLFQWDGSGVHETHTNLSPQLDVFRLDSDGKSLFSFGIKDIVWFNGESWSRIQHPDNPPID